MELVVNRTYAALSGTRQEYVLWAVLMAIGMTCVFVHVLPSRLKSMVRSLFADRISACAMNVMVSAGSPLIGNVLVGEVSVMVCKSVTYKAKERHEGAVDAVADNVTVVDSTWSDMVSVAVSGRVSGGVQVQVQVKVPNPCAVSKEVGVMRKYGLSHVSVIGLWHVLHATWNIPAKCVFDPICVRYSVLSGNCGVI